MGVFALEFVPALVFASGVAGPRGGVGSDACAVDPPALGAGLLPGGPIFTLPERTGVRGLPGVEELSEGGAMLPRAGGRRLGVATPGLVELPRANEDPRAAMPRE